MTTFGRPGVFTTENFAPLANSGPGIPGEALPAFAGIYPRGPLAPTLITSWQNFLQTYGDFTTDPGNLLPYAVYQFFNNGGNQCFILRLPNTDATAASLVLSDINSSPDSVMTVTANSPGTWGQSIFVELATAGQAGRFNVNVYFGGSTKAFLEETFSDVSINPVDRRYVQNMVNSPTAGSKYISLAVSLPNNQYLAGVNDPALISPAPLTGGSTGTSAPDLTTTIPLGFGQLLNQVLNINVPGLTNATTINALLAWADGQQDKMFVIDGPSPNFPETSAQVVTNYVSMIQGGGSINADTYGVLYAPWLQVQDPASTVAGATIYLPPGGAVLGQWSATDVARGTVKAPAGITNTLKVVNLETQFSDSDLDTLNIAQVNAIKKIPGIGFCIFGARTLHPAFPDRYVSVRRMIMKLEHDFKYICQFALFEPNDQRLWKQITSVLQNYLNGLLQANQLGGTSPADSYQVVCDDTNNTVATAAAGIVNVNVAVALLSPAEFIEITLSQFQGDGTTSVATNTPAGQ